MDRTTIGQLFGTKLGNDKYNFLVVEDTTMMVFFFFFVVNFLVLDGLRGASNRSMFALIPKLTHENQDKTKQQKNKGI